MIQRASKTGAEYYGSNDTDEDSDDDLPIAKRRESVSVKEEPAHGATATTTATTTAPAAQRPLPQQSTHAVPTPSPALKAGSGELFPNRSSQGDRNVAGWLQGSVTHPKVSLDDSSGHSSADDGLLAFDSSMVVEPARRGVP